MRPRSGAARTATATSPATSTTTPPPDGARRAASGGCSNERPSRCEGFRALLVMNHEDGGFDCPGCAWPDDPTGLRLDICENGIKHVTWEMAPREGRPRLLRRPHRQRAGRVERPRPRGGGTARRADDLRPGHRHVRADLLGGRLRPGRHDAARAGEPARGGVLHLGAAEQRGDVPLPAVGARVRHEQPARLLEHVPRGQRPGADRGDRHAARARSTWRTGSRPTRSG